MMHQLLKTIIGRHLSIILALPLAVIFISCKSTDLKQITDSLQQLKQPLDEKTVVAGLKQALEISTGNSISQTSKVGGFSDNALIHIAIPEQLSKVGSTLRKIGLGQYVDSFELQMNRSAELASKGAEQIFIASISQMTFTDAWQILRGPDNAATEYFRRTTHVPLSNRFRPIIKHSMEKIGFYRDYTKLLKTYDSIPFTKKPDLNIETYILQKSLDGLFILLAQEEKKIRRNPVARVTALLERVFGS